MSTTATDTASPAATTRRGLIPRLGSLLAFAPLGVWTVWHLWENLSAFVGAEAWQASVAHPRSPIGEILISSVIWLPLVLHTVWGLRRFRLMQVNIARYPNFDNLKYVVQRLSALGLLLFLPAHIWLARLHPMIAHQRHEDFADIAWHMRNHPPTLIVYVLGVLGISYHLANGVATQGMTWGFAASPRAMKRMNALSMLFFVLLLALGLGAVFALWRAGAGIPLSAVSDPE